MFKVPIQVRTLKSAAIYPTMRITSWKFLDQPQPGFFFIQNFIYFPITSMIYMGEKHICLDNYSRYEARFSASDYIVRETSPAGRTGQNSTHNCFCPRRILWHFPLVFDNFYCSCHLLIPKLNIISLLDSRQMFRDMKVSQIWASRGRFILHGIIWFVKVTLKKVFLFKFVVFSL